MKNLAICVICLFLLNVSVCSKLPSSFKKCDRKQADFNQCLSTAVEDAIRQLNKPLQDVGLPNMEPLEVPSLSIKDDSGSVGLSQDLKNLKIFGFTKIDDTKVDMNFDTKSLHLKCTFPELRMEFEYELNGKILLLPVYGSGPGTINLDRMKNDVTFTLSEYEKENTKYFKVIDVKFVMAPEQIRSNFENLFNGDKALGDNINKVMNENWKDIFALLKTSYEKAFAQIVFSIFNNLLAKVSINELFGEA